MPASKRIIEPLSGDPNDLEGTGREKRLESDERWLLVQRILASAGFQRAAQLRNILTYIATQAILRPDDPIREYQIACEVLGRKEDFDPVSDNIVRSQMSHLRRKLEAYFAEEGRNETLSFTIPRGTYFGRFEQVRDSLKVPAAFQDASVSSVSRDHPATGAAPPAVTATPRAPRFGRAPVFILACGLLVILCLFLTYRLFRAQPSGSKAAPQANAFVQFLSRSNGAVSVVLPDISLMMVQITLNTNLTVQDYGRSDFLEKEIEQVQDSAERNLLSQIRSRRTTSVGEALVASDFQETLATNGIHAKLLYARDLHVHDLDEGNTVLIGSQRSNPWVTLFDRQMNFHFTQNPSNSLYYFVNTNPQPGEAERYFPFERRNGKLTNYVDVALCPNLTHSGYVLMINGSDTQANEAAARFMLHGRLPPSVSEALLRESPSYFEVFLRGEHLEREAEETFEVVALRLSPPK